MKKIIICSSGIILSLVLMALFVFIDISFTDANKFVKPGYLEKMQDCELVKIVEETVWRFEYVFNPITVGLVGLLIGFLDRSKTKFLLVFISLTPFMLLYLSASSFSLLSYFFSICYLLISLVFSLFVKMDKENKRLN